MICPTCKYDQDEECFEGFKTCCACRDIRVAQRNWRLRDRQQVKMDNVPAVVCQRHASKNCQRSECIK